MPTKLIGGTAVLFDAGERDTAELIAEAAAQALRVIKENWGLDRPEDCRFYVMTSWGGFIFQSAPWPWRILLAASFPFWCFRARRTWPYSAGWTQRYGRRTAIGIKPPRLLDVSDKSVGLHMYVEEKDPAGKIRHLACHELTHACSAHLLLPAWLNEGLAAVTVDRFLGKRTIRADTLEMIRNHLPKGKPPTYREMSRMGGRTLAYHAVRGYWLVRYLEERRAGFWKQLFSAWKGGTALEDAIGRELGIEPASLWSRIDEMLAAHFGGRDA